MNNFNEFAPFLGMGIFMVIMMGIAIALLPTVFYLLTLQKTFEEVSEENRPMPPGQVWLILIPLFGLVWAFIVVERLSNALEAEFGKRNIELPEKRPAYSIGIAYCVLKVCFFIPFASIAGLICWIIYWVKINDYKNMLRQARVSQQSIV